MPANSPGIPLPQSKKGDTARPSSAIACRPGNRARNSPIKDCNGSTMTVNTGSPSVTQVPGVAAAENFNWASHVFYAARVPAIDVGRVPAAHEFLVQRGDLCPPGHLLKNSEVDLRQR